MVPGYLSELFIAAQVVTIRGVVSRNGVGGGSGAGLANGEFLWQMTFTLEAWRIEDQELKLAPLLVRSDTTHDELIKFMYRIKRDSIIQIRARVVFDDGPREEYTALMEEYIGVEEADTELVNVAQELQRPITLDLPPFPLLHFMGNSSWSGAAYLQTWAGFQIVPELYGGQTSSISDGNISLDRVEKVI